MRDALKKKWAIVAGAALAFLAVPLSARIIVVSGPSTASREELRESVRRYVADPSAEKALNAQGFRFKVSEGNTLTPELSPEGTGSAYVWSDAPVKMASGFRAPDGTRFESTVAPSAPRGGSAKGLARHVPTALTSASLANGRLHVGYAVAGAGVVTVRAYGANGKTFGKWTWTESAAGARSRSLELRSEALRGGPVWIRWTHGRYNAVRRLSAESPR